jgi:hypothetical protein
MFLLPPFSVTQHHYCNSNRPLKFEPSSTHMMISHLHLLFLFSFQLQPISYIPPSNQLFSLFLSYTWTPQVNRYFVFNPPPPCLSLPSSVSPFSLLRSVTPHKSSLPCYLPETSCLPPPRRATSRRGVVTCHHHEETRYVCRRVGGTIVGVIGGAPTSERRGEKVSLTSVGGGGWELGWRWVDWEIHWSCPKPHNEGLVMKIL